jgi:hypothetical protein
MPPFGEAFLSILRRERVQVHLTLLFLQAFGLFLKVTLNEKQFDVQLPRKHLMNLSMAEFVVAP